ncbi:MAG: putative Ig domain-containing protein, partial [Bacteroidales bacterium]|nr:putative Ig domain-containing protein [Bacteroidales bacterium]
TSGTMSGAGTTIVAAGGTLALSGYDTRFLVGRTLQVAGTGTWTDSGSLYLADAARLDVAAGGTLDLPENASLAFWYGSPVTFTNAGTVTKTTGTGTFYAGVAFVNNGQVSVGSGTLNLSAGGSGAGTWSVASGANLTLSTGSFTLANGAVNGAGAVLISGGTVEVGTGFTPTGPVTLSSGSLTLTTSAAVSQFTQSGGTLTGDGDLTVTGSLTWTSGTMSGAGTTIVAAGGTLALSGYDTRFLVSRTLRIAGTGIWTDSGSLYLADAARLEVAAGGTLDLPENASLVNWYGASSTFANAGTVTKTTGTGTFYVGVSTTNASTGRLVLGSGTLAFATGFSTAGTVEIGSETTLSISGGNYSQTAGETTLLNGTLAAETVDLAGGVLSGFGSIAGTLTQSGGEVSPGTSTMPTGVLTVTGSYSQGSAATLRIELVEPTSGHYDQLVVGGSVSIAGIVSITELAGFVNGPEFRFLTTGGTTAVSGTFLGNPDGTAWTFGGKPYLLSYAAGDGNDVALLFDGPKLSIGNVRSDEGNVGRTRFEFPVTMSRAWDVPVTVQWATQDDTAIAGEDYIAASGMLTFLPGGPLTQTVVVEVYGDLDQERSERFRVLLSDAVEAAIVTGTAIGTIANDDGVLNLPDNKGTEFWLTFLGNEKYGSPYPDSQQLSLYITSEVDTFARVEIPGLGFDQTVEVAAGEVVTVPIPDGADLGRASDTIQNRGIHVTADDEIAVYGLNYVQYTTDAFLGLPVDILGTEYMVLSYRNSPLHPQLRGTEFAVAATVDGTVLTITPSYAAGNRPAGVPYTVTLDQGQVYQLISQETDDGDLTGTVISASQPVAAFGGHQITFVPSDVWAGNHLVEQLTPIDTWGRQFLTAPLATRSGGDTFRILASEDGTVVTINDQIVATLDRGEYYEQIVNNSSDIRANHPILVGQYSNGGDFDSTLADPFLVLIPPTEQFQAEYTVTTPASGFPTNYVNLVVPEAAVGSVTRDGDVIPVAAFTRIGSTDFFWAQVPVEIGAHSLAASLPFGITIYGFNDYDSYGYTGGLALAPIASATAIGLSPPTATLSVGGTHRVTATVTDATGKRLAGIRVDFVVSGANAASGFALTDANGQAAFTYTGSVRGDDTITASVGTLTASAVADWVLAAPTIRVDSPPDGSAFPAGQTVLVTGVATAGNPNAPIASVTADGIAVTFDATGRFFARIPVGPGTRTVQFVATDVYGQTAETTHSLVGTQVPTGSIDFDSLVEVGHIRADYGRTSFDDRTNTLFADVTITNTGTYAISGPVLVGVRNLSDLSVSVGTPDGYLLDGTPYFNLTARGLVTGGLAPGAAASVFALTFLNPNRVRFVYDLVLLGTPNQAPAFTSVPPLEATVGRAYTYAASATDPDGDTLAYTLAAGPVGMTIDSATGVLNWTPNAADVGTQIVAIRTTDGHGGSATQTFTLTITQPAPNRPPVFTSIPSVGGAVHVSYGYAPVVEDADGDTLSFGLSAAPVGMTIDPTTGALTWTPSADQLGNSVVTVTVSDGQGGTASQTFVVRVTPEPGNTAPIFVSPIAGTALVGQAFAHAARAVDADGDPITYALVGAVPSGLTLASDGLVTWTPATTGTATFTVRATDGRGGIAEQTITVAVGSDAPITLSGTAFHDTDADGVWDAGEESLATWIVYIDDNSNSQHDPGERSSPVAADGTYTLTGLPAGSYSVALERPEGWVFTLPANGQRTVTAAAGETVSGLDFGAVRRIVPPQNHDPLLTATVPTTVVVGQTFAFLPTASDPDGDPLNFDLSVRPTGMAVDPLTGRVTWVPDGSQIGQQNGLLRVRDGQGGVALLPF